MVSKLKQRHSSDAHFSVLADLLFSIVMAMAALISERNEITGISVVTKTNSETGASAQMPDQNTPVVQVTPDGQLQIEESMMPLESVIQRLEQITQDQPRNVLLRVAPECRHQTVFGIYHELRNAGFAVVEEGLLEEREQVPHE